MKILTILGTRPEAIKLAPVIAEAKKHPSIQMTVCAAGQHREMLQQMLSTFSIEPDVFLDVMTPNQSLSQLTAKLMTGLSDTIASCNPDWVLVQGDTTTTFVGGLAAFYQRIKVGHIEAGLRTYQLDSPFPEELNRQMTSRLTTRHFAPTHLSAKNLTQEGIDPSRIVVTGNTVVDAISMIENRWKRHAPLASSALSDILSHNQKPIVFITCHRRESFGKPMRDICEAIRALCDAYLDHTWIFPVHPNPNVRDPIHHALSECLNLYLIDPLDYESTLYLLSRASLVLTDSGGIQEEAPSFSVPIVVMRNHTERPENINAGFGVLAGTMPEAIMVAARSYLDSSMADHLKNKSNPYGDGNASQRIIASLLDKPIEMFHG